MYIYVWKIVGQDALLTESQFTMLLVSLVFVAVFRGSFRAGEILNRASSGSTPTELMEVVQAPLRKTYDGANGM